MTNQQTSEYNHELLERLKNNYIEFGELFRQLVLDPIVTRAVPTFTEKTDPDHHSSSRQLVYDSGGKTNETRFHLGVGAGFISIAIILFLIFKRFEKTSKRV